MMAAAACQRAESDQEESNGTCEMDGAFPRHRRRYFTTSAARLVAEPLDRW
jgi:hypothetical protein